MIITGLILDIDGTLVNSNEVHRKSWTIALEKYGIFKEVNEIQIHSGKPSEEIVKILAETSDDNFAMKVAKEKTDLVMDMVDQIIIFPGVDELLRELYKLGYLICFASANFNRLIERMLKIFNWDTLASGYVGTDNVIRSKPDPEMIFKSINILNLPVNECVVIGDSIYDIEAAKKAGTKSVAVCTGEFKKEEFEIYKPNLILDKFVELRKYLPLNL